MAGSTLPRIVRRAPVQVVESDAVVFPRRECFCCDDRGLVAHRWIIQLIPDWQEGDVPQLCQRRGCHGRKFGESYRRYPPEVAARIHDDISPDLCQQLHDRGFRDWQEDCRAWQQMHSPMQINHQKLKQLTQEVGF